MFRILVVGFAFHFTVASATVGHQYVNCALLTPGEIFDATHSLIPIELREMGQRCEDQADMFSIVADDQTDPFERQRYRRFALKASIAAEQFWEAYRLSIKD